MPSRFPPPTFEGQPFSECLPPAYADTAFDRNGDWTILLSDQKTQITLSVLSMVFPDTEPVFLAFLPESRSTEMSVPKDEKNGRKHFFRFLPYLFPFPVPRRFRPESDGAGQTSCTF